MTQSATANEIDRPSVGLGAPERSDIFRTCVVTTALLVYWVSLDPFHDRSGADLEGTLGAGNIFNQIVYPILCVLTVGTVTVMRRGYFRKAAAAPFVAFLVWLVIVTALSGDPSTGLKRGLFEIITMVVAVGALGLADTPKQFASRLAVASAVVLILCYFGVAFLPSLSIHSSSDVLEKELAGDWRGMFNHKNQAGAAMAIIIFTGLFVAEVKSRTLGWLLVGLASIFLVFSMSKSTLALVPLTFLLTALVVRTQSALLRATMILLPLVLLNVATIGSSWPGPVRSLVGLVLKDTTFTSRTDLWRFSVEKTAEHPIFGYGLSGPWRTSELMYQDKLPAEPEDISGWVTELGTDSHNSYLESALQFGVPGLVILLIAIIYKPLRDLGPALQRSNNAALVRYFIRVWIFVLYLAALETVIVARSNPVWFMAVTAVVGLHLLARYPVADGAPASA